MTTTPILSIPTAARGLVRAYIKAHPDFDAYAAKLGVHSRDVKNADLIAFAERWNLLEEVKAIIAKAEGRKATPFATERLNEAVADVYAFNVKEDAAIERKLTDVSTFALDAVLANVSDFLSPLVRKELEKALQPVLEAANKPAQTIDRIVEVEAQPKAPAGQVPYAFKTGKSVEFAKLFGVRTTLAWGKRPIALWEAHGAAPAIDPFYVVDGQTMAVLATAAEHGTNVWMVGPSGSGKSTMPEQFAAYTGRPFAKIGFTRQTEVADLTGATGIKAGDTQWDDGALIQAMKRPGTVILFDEPTFAPAGVQAIIQATTDDHRSYTIHATGEVVRCAPGVTFVIADNTNGAGDETGQYAGTNQANAALVNRFKRMVRVDYMTKAQETEALMNRCPGLPQAAAEHVAEFVAHARKLPEVEGVALSLRQMCGFVGMVKDGFGSKFSFECAILNRLPNTERAAIETLATLQWNQTFETLFTGSPSTPEASNTPGDSKAAHAFDDEVSASLNR